MRGVFLMAVVFVMVGGQGVSAQARSQAESGAWERAAVPWPGLDGADQHSTLAVNELLALWLPILVASLAVFFASFLSWMILPHHKPDFKGLKDEDAVLDALRAQSPEPGFYMLPQVCSPKDLEDPATKRKWDEGPHAGLLIRPGRPNMGPSLLITFGFYLVVSVA